MPSVKCAFCEAETEPGYLTDRDRGAAFFLQWIAAPMEKGLIDKPRIKDHERWFVDGYRCTGCGRLELFAREQHE